MKHEVILLAAGSGSRMCGCVEDKILTPISGLSAFARCIIAFNTSEIDFNWTIVYRDEEQLALLKNEWHLHGQGEVRFVQGGGERQDSVRNALQATPGGAHLVFIHDSARPLIDAGAIRELERIAGQTAAAVTAHRVHDTIKRVDSALPHSSPQMLEDLKRDSLWAMETPQVFRKDLITKAYLRLEGKVTDDTAALAMIGHGTAIYENPHPNPKITIPEDLAYIEWLIQRRSSR